MDLARVKYCVDHIDKHPESLTHCNGVDMAYFIPEDVRQLIAEVERLEDDKSKLWSCVAESQEGWTKDAAELATLTAAHATLSAELGRVRAERDAAYQKGREDMQTAAIAVAEGRAARAEQVFSIQGESWCLNVAAMIRAIPTEGREEESHG